jgi:transposase
VRAAFQAVGAVKVRQHRPVSGAVKSLQLKREHRHWYVIVISETAPTPLPAAGRSVGAARALVNTCDVIALEKLSTAAMTRRPAPRPDPGRPGAFLPNMAAAKTGLNKAILDAGWAQFADILTGKAEEAGRRVLFVNPAGTSIECHYCRRTCARPKQDTVICPVHGPMDADLNGARNIATRAGLGSGQASAA